MRLGKGFPWDAFELWILPLCNSYPVVHLVPDFKEQAGPVPGKGRGLGAWLQPSMFHSTLPRLFWHFINPRKRGDKFSSGQLQESQEAFKIWKPSAFTQSEHIHDFLSLPRIFANNASIFPTHALLKYLNRGIIQGQIFYYFNQSP